MPIPALDTATVTALVKDAAAAPSMHNAQPWKFRLLRDSGTLQLYGDPARSIPHSDPTMRALHLGCGAALLNLRAAAVHAGWEPTVQLLPEPADPQLLAAVRLAGPASPKDDLAALYPALHRRHTSRHPFAETEIPPDVRAALAEAARQEQAQLVYPGAWHVQTLLDLVHDAERRDATDPGRTQDLAHWTHTGTGTGTGTTDTATDGIPEHAFGPRKHHGKAPVRDFAGRHTVTGRDDATFENTPHLVLLGTAGDRPADWLRAGQAMERVLLLATLNGLSTSLTSHALEWDDLRWAVRDPVSAMGHVQMVLRLGYGPNGPVTPRRPVQDVLDIQ